MFELLVSKELISYPRPGNDHVSYSNEVVFLWKRSGGCRALLERERCCGIFYIFSGEDDLCFSGKYIQSSVGKWKSNKLVMTFFPNVSVKISRPGKNYFQYGLTQLSCFYSRTWTFSGMKIVENVCRFDRSSWGKHQTFSVSDEKLDFINFFVVNVKVSQ